MELILPVRGIKYASSLLSTIANIKSIYTMPYIQISADEEGVKFFATSYEVAARIHLDNVEVCEPGSTLISANALNGFVARLHESDKDGTYSNPVNFKKIKNKVQVNTKTHYKQGDVVNHKLRIEEVNLDNFPVQFSIEEDLFNTLDGLYMKEALDKVGYAMSTDDTTAPVFKGARFESNGSYFRITSTDGKELARYIRNINLSEFDEVITSTVASNLAKHVDPTQEVKFYFKNGKIFLRSNVLEIMGSTISNDFPNVDRILAAENYNKFTVSKTVLQDNILNVMPNVDTKSNRISVSLKNKEISVRGEYSNETLNAGIKTVGFDGEFSFDCNGWYLHRAISKVEGDLVNIFFREPEEPLIIKAAEELPFDLTNLIVPMRRL